MKAPQTPLLSISLSFHLFLLPSFLPLSRSLTLSLSLSVSFFPSGRADLPSCSHVRCCDRVGGAGSRCVHHNSVLHYFWMSATVKAIRARALAFPAACGKPTLWPTGAVDGEPRCTSNCPDIAQNRAHSPRSSNTPLEPPPGPRALDLPLTLRRSWST